MSLIATATAAGSAVSKIASVIRSLDWLRKVPGVRRWYGQRPLRYLASVQSEFESVAGAPMMRVRPVDEPHDPDAPVGAATRSLDTFAPSRGAIHLLGGAGSGKSWAVGRYVHGLAQAEWTRRAGLDSSDPTIPVYARAGHEHLLDGLGRFLLRHGFFREVQTRDHVRDLLVRGGLTLVLDDVHLHLDTDEHRDTWGLNEILEYHDRNRIVLVGRPHVARNPYGAQQLEMAPLDKEARAQVVRHHLGPDEPQADYLVGVLDRDTRAAALYDTPQAVALVVEAVREDGRIPDRLPELFEAVHRARVEAARERSSAGVASLELSEALLGDLAFDRLRAGAYQFAEADALRAVGGALRALGVDVAGTWTAGSAISALLSDGSLVRDGGGVRFEHDRWQEHFAATHVLSHQTDLEVLASATAFAGVARLVAGREPSSPTDTDRVFWGRFWDGLVERDLSLALELLGTPGRAVRASEPVLPTAVQSRYRAFVSSYERVLDRHTGALRVRLPPQTDGAVGIVVARDERRAGQLLFRGHWMGFRALGDGDAPVVIVPSVGEAEDPHHLRAAWGVQGVSSWTPEPGVESPPMRAALQVWAHLVTDALRAQRFVEPAALIQERVYYDLSAVSAAVGHRPPGVWMPFSLDEADALVRLRSVGGVLSDPQSMGRQWSRLVRPDELARDYAQVREAARGAGVILPPVWPPLPPSPTFGEIRASPPTPQLAAYVHAQYASAFELAALNLPTLAASLQEAMGFPTRIVLRRRTADSDRFDRTRFIGVEGQREAVIVELGDDADVSRLRAEARARGETESSVGWPGTVEPLRRGAYTLLTAAWKAIAST